MPHIAHFIQRYPPALGGAESYFARLSESLAADGHSVTVWTSTAIALEEMWRPDSRTSPPNPLSDAVRGSIAPNPLSDAVRGSISIRRYEPVRVPARRYLLRAASIIPIRPWQLLTQPCNPICPQMWHDAGRYSGPLDLVHGTAFPYGFPLMCGLRLARRRRVPFFLTPFLHLGDPTDPYDRTRKQYTSPHLRWLLRQADRIFVQTPSEHRAIVDMGVLKERVILQGLGVDAAEFSSEAQPSVSKNAEVVIGHLANLSMEKGSIDLLRAAETLWKSGVNFRLVLAGPNMPNFRQFWETFPMKDRVTRLGPLSEQQKRDFYADIDFFALPSRTDSFGLVLLEAWANGKPNIAYRAGGPADIIRDGEDGLLVKCGDVAELAARLRELIESEPLRYRLGEAGRARIATDFRWPDKLAVVKNAIRTF